jgi:hypothetical protein
MNARPHRAVFAVASIAVTGAWLLLSVVGPAWLNDASVQAAAAALLVVA